MRLIDADVITIPKGFFETVDNVPKFYEWLNEQLTVDAVSVVRCKDCIHSTSQVSDDEDNYYCNAMRRCMHSLDFCSYAERKES